MPRNRRKSPDIADSGALSDLAFLLIIFFIVIAVFNVNKGFILSLPKKNSTKIVNVKDIIKVTLHSDGSLSSRGADITREELKSDTEAQLDSQPNLTFLLKIEPDTVYQDVVEVIELVRRLEVSNFSFSMEGQ